MVVLQLAISVVNTTLADEPGIAYSSGKLLHNLPVHTIATSLGGDKSSALPMFHAMTGCNTELQFSWKRRKERGKGGKCFPK